MNPFTISIPETHREFLERQTNDGQFSSVDEYVLSLVDREVQLADIEQLLDEAEADIANGKYVVHQPGDVSKRVRELIRQRRGEDSSCSK